MSEAPDYMTQWYEIDLDGIVVTLRVEPGKVTVSRSDSGPVRLSVRMPGVDRTAYASSSSMTVGITPLVDLIEQSDLSAEDKRAAGTLLQHLTPTNVLLLINILKGSSDVWDKIAPLLRELFNSLR